ncbi:conserved hypothetical protein [Bradyrhizobium sp. STM 3843]|nr:conserved hypothetical protein [Bradyrhizobium sp. STM 3843]
MDRNVLFKCPRTGINVQHWLSDTALSESDQSYVSMPCPACGSLHFVNSRTGKLLVPSEPADRGSPRSRSSQWLT